MFHAGTAAKKIEGKEEEAVVTSGGRVLAIVGLAQRIIDAQKTAYDGIRKICFDGIQYRSDIASRACRYDYRLRTSLSEVTQWPLCHFNLLFHQCGGVE